MGEGANFSHSLPYKEVWNQVGTHLVDFKRISLDQRMMGLGPFKKISRPFLNGLVFVLSDQALYICYSSPLQGGDKGKWEGSAFFLTQLLLGSKTRIQLLAIYYICSSCSARIPLDYLNLTFLILILEEKRKIHSRSIEVSRS